MVAAVSLYLTVVFLQACKVPCPFEVSLCDRWMGLLLCHLVLLIPFSAMPPHSLGVFSDIAMRSEMNGGFDLAISLLSYDFQELEISFCLRM